MVATGVAGVAHAKQIIPMHTQDVQKTVTQPFHSVAVSADYADVTLRPGRTTTVQHMKSGTFGSQRWPSASAAACFM